MYWIILLFIIYKFLFQKFNDIVNEYYRHTYYIHLIIKEYWILKLYQMKFFRIKCTFDYRAIILFICPPNWTSNLYSKSIHASRNSGSTSSRETTIFVVLQSNFSCLIFFKFIKMLIMYIDPKSLVIISSKFSKDDWLVYIRTNHHMIKMVHRCSHDLPDYLL